ncbi:hypothetical protein PJL18_02806 [Paenarthrobacter nicotinovorans]|nr:hypothetical protein [Paenarthrobacter nicotinovorans]
MDTVAVNQRALILMESHSSKWFSPSRRNHQPARMPATTGNASAMAPKSNCPAGRLPRIGTAGSGPTEVPSGPAVEPMPSEKPAPEDHDKAKITRLGRKPSWAIVSTAPPKAPACRPS